MLTLIGPTIIIFLMFIGGAIIFSSWQGSRNPLIGSFCLFFLGFGVMHIFLVLGIYLSTFNPSLASIFYLIAHTVLFFTLAFFLRVPINLIVPKIEKPLFSIAVLAAFISVLIISLNPPLPTATSQGIINWNVPDQSMKTIGTFTGLTLLSAIILFIISAIKAPEKLYKLRFLLFTLGISLFLIMGPMHNIATTTTAHLIADALTLPGALLLIGGIFLPRIYQKRKSI